ncbi:MAG: hypothetical protein MUF87_08775 [Anaerolineae bacterium]|jgi:hypothetical protein|nr:hypothetical protein [Anaerolineae bacterium]
MDQITLLYEKNRDFLLGKRPFFSASFITFLKVAPFVLGIAALISALLLFSELSNLILGRSLNVFFLVTTVIFLMVASIALFYFLQLRRINLRLALKGVILPSAIEQISGQTNQEGLFIIKLVFTVTDPNTSEVIKLQGEYPCQHRKDQSLPSVGSPIAVLYHDRDLYRVL